jgi:hypothetical protein
LEAVCEILIVASVVSHVGKVAVLHEAADVERVGAAIAECELALDETAGRGVFKQQRSVACIGQEFGFVRPLRDSR